MDGEVRRTERERGTNWLDALRPDFLVQLGIDAHVRCLHHFLSKLLQFFHSSWCAFLECSTMRWLYIIDFSSNTWLTFHVSVCEDWQCIHEWQPRWWSVSYCCHFHLSSLSCLPLRWTRFSYLKGSSFDERMRLKWSRRRNCASFTFAFPWTKENGMIEPRDKISSTRNKWSEERSAGCE